MTDLVEYLIVVVPDIGSLKSVAAALAQLVQADTIHLLDLAVVAKADDGAVTVHELGSLDSMKALAELEGELEGLLSEQDLELISVAVEPGTAGLVLVSEDRWAEPLSIAARIAGGQVIAGERIPAARVEAALANRPEPIEEDQ